MTYLLDVNVLIALFDSEHLHHEAAHSWFASVGQAGWATCPIVENGFVRVVTNRAYPNGRISILDAVAKLNVFCSEPGHAFWEDSVTVRHLDDRLLLGIGGHQQITDMYLAALANHNHGKLATFDKRIATAMRDDFSAVIELISE
ncbi:TA system VapC family ribonuclease toxin [Botrimarina mediterranea]|uniref:TA system VapC family ribonuclease toxin n=1 Tax=Botrimarina mediterranea TaxID=2528022 RepID=UPI0011894782|nr:TA system VapC family ribonuclease toxin [Botrimarina mediterranea]QDV76894.1 Ribonuclease VapC39 [Planctomycetes bacterium K2D]